MNSSWLDPEGSEPSRIPLGGWLSFGGSCVEEFSSMVREPFWVSSTTGSLGFLFVCAIEGWFSSWEHSGRHCWVFRFFTAQAKCIHEGGTEQNSRVSPSCKHVSSSGWLGDIYTPQPLLHNDLNAPTCLEYSMNIPGRRSFYRLECTNCLLYLIRAWDAIPKVLCNLRVSAGPSGAFLVLWRVSEASGPRGDLRAPRIFGFVRRLSAASLGLQPEG